MILPLSPSFVHENGETCRPACCYIGNISRSTDKGVPPLLRYSEVKTMFHEFGHALNIALSRTKYQYLSGARGTLDMIEIPSHFTELFLTDYQFVK